MAYLRGARKASRGLNSRPLRLANLSRHCLGTCGPNPTGIIQRELARRTIRVRSPYRSALGWVREGNRGIFPGKPRWPARPGYLVRLNGGGPYDSYQRDVPIHRPRALFPAAFGKRSLSGRPQRCSQPTNAFSYAVLFGLSLERRPPSPVSKATRQRHSDLGRSGHGCKS
jgi:hypothetical protein